MCMCAHAHTRVSVCVCVCVILLLSFIYELQIKTSFVHLLVIKHQAEKVIVFEEFVI